MTENLVLTTGPSEQGVVSLLDLDPTQLGEFVMELGEPRFRAQQVWDWLYKQYVADFAAMTNLPKSLRQRLD